MNSIADNFKIEECSGCGACVNSCPLNAISYSKDEYGFILPSINESICISCGKCLKVCPFQNVVEGNVPQQAYAAICKDESALMNSSSGGIFFVLAKKILQKGGCVFGATLDENFEVKHVCIESLEDLPKLQKSKYVQSFIGNSYSVVCEKLKDGKFVLFSGTPCQIAAMKACLRGIPSENLILVEVVCHGIPNQQLFKDYVENLQKRGSLLKSYIFRYKRKLQNGINEYLRYELGNRTKVKNWPDDSYNFLFMSASANRDSCFSCKYAKKERVSDITLCDYWHWSSFHDKDFKPCSTVSGIAVNTEKGQKILDEVCGELQIVNTDFENIAKYNGCLLKPTPRPENRQFVLDLWKNSGYAAVESWYKKKYRWRRLKSKLMMFVPETTKLRVHNLRVKLMGALRGH